MKSASIESILKASKDVNYLTNINVLSDETLKEIVYEFYNWNYNKILFNSHMLKNPDNFNEKNGLFMPPDFSK